MFPKPKTKRGEIWLQILNAEMILFAVLFVAFIIYFPFLKSFTDFDLLFYPLVIILMFLPGILGIEGVLTFIKRAAFIRKKDFENNIFNKITRAVYILVFILSLPSIPFSFLTIVAEEKHYLRIDESILYEICKVVSLSGLPFLIIGIIFLYVSCYLSKRKAKRDGVEIQKYGVNIFKSPLLYISLILFALLICCIPFRYEGYSHNDKKYVCIDSIAFSYVREVDKDTGETVNGKLLFSPRNIFVD